MFRRTRTMRFLDYDFFQGSFLKKIVLFICENNNLCVIKLKLPIVFKYNNDLISKFIFKKPILFLFFIKTIILKKIKEFISKFFLKKNLIHKKINILIDLTDNKIKNVIYFKYYIGKLVKCRGVIVKKDRNNLFSEQKIYFNEFLSLTYENDANFSSNFFMNLDCLRNFDNTDCGFSKFKNFGLFKVVNNISFNNFQFMNLFVEKYVHDYGIPGDNIECIGIFLIFFLNNSTELNLNANVCMLSIINYINNNKSHQIRFLFSEILFNISIYKFSRTYISLEQNFLITAYLPINFKKIFFFIIKEINKNKNLHIIQRFKNLSFLFVYNRNIFKRQTKTILTYLCNDYVILGGFSWLTLFNSTLNLKVHGFNTFRIDKKVLFNLISITSKKIIIIDELNKLDNNFILFFNEILEHQILNFNNLGYHVKIFLNYNCVVFLKNNQKCTCLDCNTFEYSNHLFHINRYDLVFSCCKVKEKIKKFKVSAYLQFKRLQLELNIFEEKSKLNYKKIKKRQNIIKLSFSSIKKLLIYINKIEKKFFYSNKTMVVLRILFIKLRTVLIQRKKNSEKFLISKFVDALTRVSILNSQIRMSSEILIFDIVQSIYLLKLFQFNNAFLQF